MARYSRTVRTRAWQSVILLLLSTLLLATEAESQEARGGPGIFRPAPVVFITYDNSSSMDFTTEFGSIPTFPATCDPNVEYVRTRHVIGLEALTGTMVAYCPIEEARVDTPGTRDDTAPFAHTRPQLSWQRQDGLLDVYGDQIYFGLGTFDSLPSALDTAAGDYSYGPDYPVGPISINVGLANSDAPIGGLISPLPPGWLPPTPGAVTAFRLDNNGRIQDSLMQVIPGGETPLVAALDDVQYFANTDPGMRSDPFIDCREFVHVLITDGTSDDSTDPPYTITAAEEATNLAEGTCDNCPNAPVNEIDTWVVAFAVDDGETSFTDAIAAASDTCAIVNESGGCEERTFRAASQAELVFGLGSVFNQQVDARLSAVTPLTSTAAFETDIGLVRFRGGANVSHTSPYWTGFLTRQDFGCVPESEEPDAATIVAPVSTTALQDQYTPEFAATRAVYTARLDVAASGASCERPACPIGSDGCVYPGAIAELEVTDGDGTGGMDSSGTNTDEDVLPPASVSSCGSLAPRTASEYATCVTRCSGDAECLCGCQEFYGCGACGYVAAAPACDNLLVSTCQLTCPILGILISECECFCQELLGCGECWDGVPDTTPTLPANRAAANEQMRAARSLAPNRSNDTPLPTPAVVSGVFDGLETSADSCLIPFDTATFITNQDLTPALYASGIDAERVIEFTRGATLQALEDASLLGPFFDKTLIPMHDRVDTGYVGDFLHTRMALVGRPNLLTRDTPGWRAFVAAHGSRPYTLFAGANDGMLHAYDAVYGNEVWSIIPPSFLPQLDQMMISHRASVDGAIAIKDVLCRQVVEIEDGEEVLHEDWCTLLAVSYRGGGSGAMVLDVTNPLAPRFLFEVTGQQIPELGLGYPAPLLGNMLVELDGEPTIRPVLVLAGGRPLSGPENTIGSRIRGSHEGETVVILDALNGEVYRQFDPVSDPAIFAQCGPVTGSPAGWSPQLFTRIFVGTSHGCLLRVDTSPPGVGASADPDNWTLQNLFQLESQGEVVFAPAVAPRPDGSLVIVYGTGNLDEFEHVNQLGSLASVSEIQHFFGNDPDNGVLSFDDLDDVPAEPNWELALLPGEMLTTQPIISDGIVIVGSWVPATNACDGGSSRIYTLDYQGDVTVDGVDATRPWIVDIDSARLRGRFDNPDYIDGVDDPADAVLKFLGTQYLGENTVVFGISLSPVPSCTSISSAITADATEIASTRHRQLIIDVMGDLASTEGGSGGEGNPEPSDDEPEIGIISIEQSLPYPVMPAVPLDWGVVLEF